jgi:C1A family cysteine protease
MKNLSLLLVCLFLTSSLVSQEEFGTGLKFDESLYNEIPQSVPLVTRSFTSLPKSYSLKGYAPTPQSQGRQGSCVGWASAYGARTIANAIKNGWKYNTAKINQNTFSPSFVYNQIRYNAKCEGAYIENAMKVMNNYGAAKLSDFPYTDKSCLKTPSSYTFSKAKNHKILTFERLAKWNSPYNLVGKVKKALSQKNPVVIGLFRFSSLKTDYNNVWIPSTGKSGHAMVVVGYDDNKSGGAFEIMNSWGTRFGKNGFFWVKYADFQRQVKTAYVLVDKSNNNDIKNNNDNNNNNNNTYSSNKLGGEITLKLSNGNDMPVKLAEGATRNFNIVKASKTTYKVNNTYTSGTQFRIYLTSKQRGYVYLIGYGSADKSVNKLYPFGGFSDYFNYTNSEIAIPNEDYFIEFDNNPGRDILCVLYSKEKLNISDIVNKAKSGSGDFVTRVKAALSYKMFKGSNVSFNSNKISFNASSNSSSAKVVPVFIEMNHQ